MAADGERNVLERPEFDRPVKLLVVVAPYYQDIAEDLVAGAQAEIEAAGGGFDVVEVPGVLEVPTAIAMADRLSSFDGYVALGCVIGAAELAGQAAHGLTMLGLGGLAVGNGIVTAKTRADVTGAQDKGAQAAAAALHLIALRRKWGGSGKKVGFTPAGSYKIADRA
ncbi:MAG: 6,7-dimethyl-8-ribityllumazine synthase [Rhodobacterales bacterium]|nr:MAG: 6,7-dimethyl-8-ribityllumazine synthase [Rhodobacterales bacterium]